ncbi:MAG: hypothetical protein AAFV69_11200 [Pseudomonadota bacterium]
MIEGIQSNPWSEALGCMMQKDANRRFLMSLERRSSKSCDLPEGNLVDAVRTLVEERAKTS